MEALLDDIVTARGQTYRDLLPLLEIELVGLAPLPVASPTTSKSQDANKSKETNNKPRLVWRVTLRCVISYHKDTPQPVVATSADLGMAMRLLETQIAASTGAGASTGGGGEKTANDSGNGATANAKGGNGTKSPSSVSRLVYPVIVVSSK